MSRPIRIFGVWLILAAAALMRGTAAWAQNRRSRQPQPAPDAATVRQGRARPGKPSDIRFFDVKHIKAELTIDTKKREVRGTVTHTLTPAPSLPHAGRARLWVQSSR